MKSSGLTTMPSPPRPVSSVPPGDRLPPRSPGRSRPRPCTRSPAAAPDRRRQTVGQRLHVPEVVLVRVDVPFGRQQVERGQLQVVERRPPASNTAGRRRRTARRRSCRRGIRPRLLELGPRRRRSAGSPPGPARRPLAAAPPGRPRRRRRTASCSSSCALADHGISSQSRQTQSCLELVPEVGGGQRRRAPGRGTAPPAPASLKNRRPVRV